MKRHIVVLAMALALSVGRPPAAASGESDTQPVFSTADYADVLDRYVDDRGLVDYAGLKAHPERLEAFVDELGSITRATYDRWSDDAKIAFWLNAYNALTLELIVHHYPIKPLEREDPEYPPNSIRHIPGAWTEVTFPVMGEPMTLDHIEHGILREKFEEPRIHMALVCAAVSCPPLRRSPYRADSLSDQLDDQARRFLARPGNFRIDRDRDVVWLSSIFDWFAADFVGKYGESEVGRLDEARDTAVDFISRYVGPADRAYLETGDYEVEYTEYDWTLNERTP